MDVYNPTITIVTVVYNGASTIEQTIQNVISQTYQPIEFIVVDGCSMDGTVKIIEQYSNHITHWISEPDKGIYDAMNKGWAMANDSSYILFLGSGDKVFQLPNMNNHKHSDIIFGDVILGNKNIFRSNYGFKLRLGNTIHHQAMLIKKAINPITPFSLDFKVYADFDFNQRLHKAGIKFHKDKNFYTYALEGGVSTQFNASESSRVVKKNYGILMYFLAVLYYKLQKINGFRKSYSSNSSL